jgi:ubiquitin carboxyl-terminal hydrolase 10
MLKPDSYVTVKPAPIPTARPATALVTQPAPAATALETPDSSMSSSDSSDDDEFVTPVSSRSSTPADESTPAGEAVDDYFGKSANDQPLPPTKRKEPLRIKKAWDDITRAPLGLDNRGVTCYMNAAIQAIIHVPAMAHYLQALYKGNHKQAVSQSSVSHDFAHLYNRLTGEGTKRKSVYPGKLIRRLDDINCMMSEWQQEDSHEYFMSLMGRLQEDTVPKGQKLNSSIIHDIFGGNINQKVTCQNCSHISTTHQDFYDLPVSFSARERREGRRFTLEGSIKDFFSPELIKPDAKHNSGYQCDKCKRVTRATKRNMINDAPEYLAVHIKRFKFQGSSSQKLKEPMAYPLELDLSAYSVKNEQIHYRLDSVIVHEGRHVSSGHYIALCRQPNGTWAEYDDETIRPISEKFALKQESAYMLMYSRVDHSTPLKQRRTSSVSAATKPVMQPIGKSPIATTKPNANAVPAPSPTSSPSLKRPSAGEDIDRIFSLAKKRKVPGQA